MTTVRFAVADELTCYYDRPGEPANVHLEARVPGRLDQAGVRRAVHAVLEAEPDLRIRRRATSKWRSGFYWEYQGVTDTDPVLTASYADEAELGALRSAMLSESPPLRTSPPLRFLLASGPASDALILNAHHALLDGLSCLRLFRQVAGQYSAQAGFAPSRAIGGLRAIGGSGVSPGWQSVPPGRYRPGRGAAWTDEPGFGEEGRQRLKRPGPIAKIARQPEPGRPDVRHGYGTQQLTWDGLGAVAALRSAGASVNDLLIAALIMTIGGWNESHGRRPGLIAITMPVGDRAQAGLAGKWANASRLTTVTARVDQANSADLLSDVAAQTRYAKDHAGPQVDLFCRTLAAMPVPIAVKNRLLRMALGLAGSVLCDTCLVSNLGITEPIVFGQTAASQLWFSTFAHMPRGLSLGALTVAGRLHLTFRYRRALLSEAAAASFASSYAGVLDRLTSQVAAS